MRLSKLHFISVSSMATLATLILGLFIIVGLHTPPVERALDLHFVPPPAHIERFAFGYNDTLADLLWLRVLQDIDVCENAKGGVARPHGVTDAPPVCKFGWVFKMLDAITSLSPPWRMPYAIGGTLLSLLVNDRDGATSLLEKGMRQFPTDYGLHYTAAYHYIYEEINFKRAAEVLLVAAQNGGPAWFYALAGNLYSKAGQASLAKSVLEDALKQNLNAQARARIEMRLKEAEAIIETEAMKAGQSK